MRSVATYGRTVEQLFKPKNITAINIDPRMLNKSCSVFLWKERRKRRNLKASHASLLQILAAGSFILSTINKQKFNQACNFCLLPWIYKDGNRVFDMFLFFCYYYSNEGNEKDCIIVVFNFFFSFERNLLLRINTRNFLFYFPPN